MTRKLNGTFARWLTHGGGQEIINADIARKKKLPKKNMINVNARKAFRRGIPILAFALFALVAVSPVSASAMVNISHTANWTCWKIDGVNNTQIHWWWPDVTVTASQKYFATASSSCARYTTDPVYDMTPHMTTGQYVVSDAVNAQHFFDFDPVTNTANYWGGYAQDGGLLTLLPTLTATSTATSSPIATTTGNVISFSPLWEARLAILFYGAIFALGLISGLWIIKRIW